jgi:hypothetical protein
MMALSGKRYDRHETCLPTVAPAAINDGQPTAREVPG